MCKESCDNLLVQLGHQVRVDITDLNEAPLHVGFQLRAMIRPGNYVRSPYPSYPTRGYTLDLQVAKGWVDIGGRAEVCKLWELPGGYLVTQDPRCKLPTYAWRPYRLGSAQP